MFCLEDDKPLKKITYSHLKIQHIMAKDFFKSWICVYFTKKNTSGKRRIPAILYYEPTKTINYSDLGANVENRYGEASLYDEDGRKLI